MMSYKYIKLHCTEAEFYQSILLIFSAHFIYKVWHIPFIEELFAVAKVMLSGMTDTYCIRNTEQQATPSFKSTGTNITYTICCSFSTFM